MSDQTPLQIRLSDLPNRRETRIDLAPDAATRAQLATDLGISAIRKLRFSGTLSPSGRRDWHLAADLGATVVQPCGLTLDPVTTRIDEAVERHYLAAPKYIADDADEVEMPEDDTSEPAPEVLDLVAVMTEALALAIPPYPRSPGATLHQSVFTEPGKAPMTDEDTRPFAGLADLRNALKNKGDDDSDGA